MLAIRHFVNDLRINAMCVRGTIAAAFLLSVASSSLAGSEAKQVMAVEEGTKATFVTGRSVTIDAFCLEAKVRSAATRGDTPRRVLGNVVISSKNKPDAAMSFEEAVRSKLIALSGDDGEWSGTSLTLTALSDAVQEIRFSTTFIAAFGDERTTHGITDERLKLMAEHFEAISAKEPRISAVFIDEKERKAEVEERRKRLQYALAYNVIPLVESKEGSVLELSTIRADKECARLRFLSLDSQADCSLLRTSEGDYVLHDVGVSESEIPRLLDLVEFNTERKKCISIVITHAHRDHYKGLAALLANEDVLIKQVIIGYPRDASRALADGEPPQGAFASLLRTLMGKSSDDGDAKYELQAEQTTSGQVSIFVRKGVDAPIAINQDRRLVGSDDLDTYSFDIGSLGVRLQWLKITDLGKIDGDLHRFNIVVTYFMRGVAVLDFGDGDERHLAALLKQHQHGLARVAGAASVDSVTRRRAGDGLHAISSEKAWQIEVEKQVYGNGIAMRDYEEKTLATLVEPKVMKWPHHAWFPDQPSKIATLRALIKATRPSEIWLSVRRGESGVAADRIKKIEDFVKGICEDETGAGRPLSIIVRSTAEIEPELHSYRTLRRTVR